MRSCRGRAIALVVVTIGHWITSANAAPIAQQTSDRSTSTEAPVTALAVAPDGQIFLRGSPDGVVVQAMGASTIHSTIGTKLDHVLSIAFSQDHSMVALAGGSPASHGLIELWSWPAQKHIGTLEGHEDLVHDVAWLEGDTQLVSASADHNLQVWDVGQLRSLQTLSGHSGPVLALALSPDRKMLCSAGVDNTIRIWKTESWQIERTLNNHLGVVNHLAFRSSLSDSGHWVLASASEDATLRIWYPEIGRLVRIVRHPEPVLCVAYSADGERLFSGSNDGQVRELIHDNTSLVSLVETQSWIMSLAIGGQPGRLLYGTADGQLAGLRLGEK